MRGELTSVLECLSFLAPKSNLYPLYFDQEKSPLSLLVELSSSLTEKERSSLENYGFHCERIGTATIPSRRGVHILGYLPSFESPGPMRTLYHDYPSFLFCWLMRAPGVSQEERLVLLLQGGFSRDRDEQVYDEYTVRNRIANAAMGIFLESDTDRCIRAVRTLVYTPSISGVMVELPYDIPLPTETTRVDTHDVIHLAQMIAGKARSSDDERMVTLARELDTLVFPKQSPGTITSNYMGQKGVVIHEDN